MKITVSEDGLEFQFACDGFPFESFNKAGKMDLWAIAKQFEVAGVTSFVNNFMGLIEPKIAGAFVKVQNIDISPDFYVLASIFSPWRLSYRLRYIGTTSFWTEQVITCEGSEKELVRLQLMVVRIDFTTRRPIPLAEDGVAFVKKTAKKAIVAAPRVEFPATIPDSAVTYTFSTNALPSESDANRHVNQATAMKYCVNCASLAAMQGGVLHKFSREMDYYNMTKFVVEYVGEMQTGDLIKVVCWQDSKDLSTLYFHVKDGDKVSCRCIGKWQTNSDGNLVEFSQKIISDSAVVALQNNAVTTRCNL